MEGETPQGLFTFAQRRIKEKIPLQKNIIPHAQQKISNKCSDEL
jgi:hypothetical protein